MENCIFCKIINGNIAANIQYEDEHVLAFDDVNPQAPVHILVIPKKHISSIMDIGDNDLFKHLFSVIKNLVTKLNLMETGFRVVSNCGENAGQTVSHLHFHILAGRPMRWPPG